MGSVIIKKIGVMLIKRTTPDGKIERKKLFEVISERIGKIPDEDRKAVVRELKDQGLIVDSDKFSFVLNREF